jgi:hypothetical protein
LGHDVLEIVLAVTEETGLIDGDDARAFAGVAIRTAFDFVTIVMAAYRATEAANVVKRHHVDEAVIWIVTSLFAVSEAVRAGE